MEDDPRFKGISTDPRFRGLPARFKKTKIDSRFKAMFSDEKFKVKNIVDKRGKLLAGTSNDHLRKFYDLSSSEDEEHDSRSSDQSEEHDSRSDQSEDQSTNAEALPILHSDGKAIDGIRAAPKNDPNLKMKTKLKGVDKKKRVKKSKKERVEKDSSSEEESGPEEIHPAKDYARGLAMQDSSSDEDDDDEEVIPYDQLAHDDRYWGELDRDAPQVDDATVRLAVMHMDWDRVKAVDLLMLLNSFKPATGIIHHVKIYPSDYGKERMKEEEMHGPIEIKKGTELMPKSISQKSEKEQEKLVRENLRQYQLNRLKYFYAVVTCDSPETANYIYTQCDGREYLSTCTILDLRFVPDGMEFDESEVKDMANHIPDTYVPNFFANTALGQSLVRCSWDETNPDRFAVLSKKYAAEELENMDLNTYLASSSDDEVHPKNCIGKFSKDLTAIERVPHTADAAPDIAAFSDASDEGPESEETIQTYRKLLLEGSDNKAPNEKDIDMEIVWDTGLKASTKSAMKKKIQSKEMTVFEKKFELKKQKKKERKQMKKENATPLVELEISDHEETEKYEQAFSDDELPEEVLPENDMKLQPATNNTKTGKKKGKSKVKGADPVNTDPKEAAGLSLLVLDTDVQEKKHFNMKDIIEYDNMTKSKRKRKLKRNQLKPVTDDFQVDVHDKRFEALYSSHLYNVDPTAQEYKKTKSMEAIVSEKQRRINQNDHSINLKSSTAAREKTEAEPQSVVKRIRPDLMTLVKSIKAKTQKLDRIKPTRINQ